MFVSVPSSWHSSFVRLVHVSLGWVAAVGFRDSLTHPNSRRNRQKSTSMIVKKVSPKHKERERDVKVSSLSVFRNSLVPSVQNSVTMGRAAGIHHGEDDNKKNKGKNNHNDNGKGKRTLTMVYIGSDGNVKQKRSPWRVSIITDIFQGIYEFLAIFLRTIFNPPQLETVSLESVLWCPFFFRCPLLCVCVSR